MEQKPIPFIVMYTTLAGRFYETNDRVEDGILQQAIGLAERNKAPLWHGKLHHGGGLDGATLQVAVAWESKRVWVGLDPDPEFEAWMRDLTAGLE